MNKDLIITLLTQARDGLISTAQAVPDDKLTWKPLDNGRTALDCLGEAAQSLSMVRRMVESNGEDLPSYETFQHDRQERANWTREDALSHLREHSDGLFAAVRALSDEDLARPLTLTIGGGLTLPLAGWLMMPYRSMISRFAQINYIQTLYGDFDRH